MTLRYGRWRQLCAGEAGEFCGSDRVAEERTGTACSRGIELPWISISDLDLSAQLDHAVGRQVKERRRGAGVHRHERKQLLAQERHARSLLGRDQRFTAEKE